MSGSVLDDLFREFGNEGPYFGSFAWKAEMDKNTQARKIFQDFANRIKNGGSWDEYETEKELSALGYLFEPWYASGWHK